MLRPREVTALSPGAVRFTLCFGAGRKIAQKVQNGRFATPRPGELQRSVLDVTRAARDLDWKATTPLRDGVAAVFRWVQARQPDRAGC